MMFQKNTDTDTVIEIQLITKYLAKEENNVLVEPSIKNIETIFANENIHIYREKRITDNKEPIHCKNTNKNSKSIITKEKIEVLIFYIFTFDKKPSYISI